MDSAMDFVVLSESPAWPATGVAVDFGHHELAETAPLQAWEKSKRYLRRNPNAMSRPYPNFIARVIHSIAKGSSTLACLRGPASNASNPRSVIKPATTSFALGSSPQ